MELHPLMDIRFPPAQEAALLQAMKCETEPPWQWQAHDAFRRPPQPGTFYFHRDGLASDPPCTLCIRREAEGHLIVQAIVPDLGTVVEISVDQYVHILRDFETLIAGPAADALGGMTSIGTSTHTLEDYFSPKSLRLLENFCTTSNATDLGSHLSDQEKWMDFLLQVFREDNLVHCDTFGGCLKAKGWWPESGIRSLVSEFDFSQRLLRQARNQSIT
jgi:hypothetical protein